VTGYEQLLQALDTSGVEFIIVGGFAAILHGFARSVGWERRAKQSRGLSGRTAL
jgi:hypothetical protein